MKGFLLSLAAALALSLPLKAQTALQTNQSTIGGSATLRQGVKDSLDTGHKEIPKGVRVWKLDPQFGDITRCAIDTVTHLFNNSGFTHGLYSEYNTLGTLGSPRINRVFTDRNHGDDGFFFTAPYDFFLRRPSDYIFTNTLSPYANLTYMFCGNRTNGEDNFHAKYAVNAGKRFGAGFSVDYLYNRGYYSDQSTSLLDVSFFASYIGDQYQAHLLISTDRIKIAENGGITDDDYITHPESFDDNYATSEIPTMLSYNWNRNKGTHAFLTHRYSLGFRRKVMMTEEEIAARKFAIESKKDNEILNRNKEKHKQGIFDEDETGDETVYEGRPDNAVVMGDDNPDAHQPDSIATNLVLDAAAADSLAAINDSIADAEEWMKTEFVPVTSFIHTFEYDTNERIYQAYTSPAGYYADSYYDSTAIRSDSIFDKTRYHRIRNTFALSLLEGFNKWIFAGLKAFVTSDLQHYELPDQYNRLVSYNTHNLSIGAQMSRTQGKAFHYNVSAETWLMGDEQGQLKIQGSLDLNFPLFGDTMTLAARGFFFNETPNYYLRHFHSQHYWWDDDLGKSTHTRIEALLNYQKTRTMLRFAIDEMTDYTYLRGTYALDSLGRFGNSVSVQQCGDAITVLTASIKQHFIFGPLNWETVLTWQKSTKQDVLPVPSINIYTNLFLRFRVAKVLLAEMGGDMRWFSEYAAPDYNPGVGQYVVQGNEEKVKIGNYPIINVYANFNLKGTRFFVMYTHVNCGSGNGQYFLTPHYPLNRSILRFGLSWTFFN
ncbi:MAG: putative porin [Prevotella sp.]|nr:putative porin [Prevotella sp.]